VSDPWKPGYTEGPFDERTEAVLKKLQADLEQDWAATTADPPDVLWHYTDAEGFRSIVTNGNFRFSHARVLNDPTEIALGWSRVTSELDAEILREVHLREFFTMTKTVAGGVHAKYHYFIFSLSERDDSLSQWRAYGSAGSGYALGFPTNKIGKAREDGEFYLARLVYKEDRQRALVRAAILRTRAAFNEILEQPIPPDHQPGIIHRANVSLSQYLLRISLLFKDASFEDESEWRLIVGYSAGGGDQDVEMMKRIDFRSSGGLAKPFIDFDFRYDGDAKPPILPLRFVRYGPTLRPTATDFSATFFLAQKGYSGVPVQRSDVPLEA
jgi:hypothetical protein